MNGFGAVRHDRCDPAECQERRRIDAAEAQQDREDQLNDQEHARIVAEARAAGQEDEAYHNDRKRKAAMRAPSGFREDMATVQEAVKASATHYTPTELRAMRVQSLEEALLEARAEQGLNGELGSLQPLRNVVGDALRLAEHKEKTYGGAWRSQGYMGNLARIQSKNARLRHMLWCDPDGDAPPIEDPDGEAVRDTLLDLINLAGFMLLNWEEGNRWGS